MRAAVLPLLLLCTATLVTARIGNWALVSKRTYETCYPVLWFNYFICDVTSDIDIFVPSGNSTDQDPDTSEDPSEIDETVTDDTETPETTEDPASEDDSTGESVPSDTDQTADSVDADADAAEGETPDDTAEDS